MVAAGALLLSLVLAGCTNAATPPPSPPSTSESSTPSAPPSTTEPPTPTATIPPVPTLDPAGSASDNLPFFTSVIDAVWAGPDNVSGRAYIDALTAAGFDKAAMQVTSDTSTVGNPAESIQFSVRWKDDCLIGEVGPSIGSAVAVVLPGLADGLCLLGETRPIDW